MRDDAHQTHRSTNPGFDVDRAVRFVRGTEPRMPQIALILGSGLGNLADELEEARVFSTASIPGYPTSSVPGHAGQFVVGRLGGKVVAMVRGRVHCYEGYEAHVVAFPVRLLHALGTRRLIVTNAAGGIGPNCKPGSIMLISDHLNMTFRQPVPSGLPIDGSERGYYDPEWLERACAIAADMELPVSTGVYIWTLGPSYETKAEISFFARAGADAVGMSTVPEVIQAHALNMSVLGISTITNAAAGLSKDLLAHEDVLAVGASIQHDVRRFIHRLVRDSAG